MAEQERHTKAERREEKRGKRAEEEAAAAAIAKKARVRNGVYGVSLVTLAAVLITLAVGNRAPVIENALTVSSDAVAASLTSNGCVALDVPLLEARTHLQPATAPPAASLYTNGRPTASGPHYETAGPIFNGVRNEPLDERSTTHNLEHGSVIVWFDDQQLSTDDVSEIGTWVKTLNNAGFQNQSGSGAGILAGPVGDGGIDSGQAIAIRYWGGGLDCDSWDETYANGVVVDNFGTRGNAPESPLGPYPVDALEYSDQDGPTPAGTDAPTSAPTDTPSTEPTEAQS